MGAESFQAARAAAMRKAHAALNTTVTSAIREPEKHHRHTYSLQEVTYVLGVNTTKLFLMARQGQGLTFTPLDTSGDSWIFSVPRVPMAPYATKPTTSARETYKRFLTVARESMVHPDEAGSIFSDIKAMFDDLPRGIQEELRTQGMSPEYFFVISD